MMTDQRGSQKIEQGFCKVTPIVIVDQTAGVVFLPVLPVLPVPLSNVLHVPPELIIKTGFCKVPFAKALED